jgi:16S rRNA (cytosine1402-N4)-methyltransferase
VSHRSVLYQESLDALAIKPDGVYVDATFGRGGHANGILSQLNERGRLIAFDRDPEAIEAASSIKDPRFSIAHSAFSHLQQVLNAKAPQGVDGVLMDLGVSSPQLDNAQRGFSFKQDGPLDMRMDTTQGMSALQWLEQASEQEITYVLREYGQERAAVQIAKTIVARRRDSGGAAFQTTRQLAALVASVIGRRQGREGGRSSLGKDPATRTFQAIRIFINQELEELKTGLSAAVSVLREGGRVAVISFHSLEDRIVKQFFALQSGQKNEVVNIGRLHTTFAAGFPIASEEPAVQASLRLFKKVMPSAQETSTNPRARSAVLRFAQRTASTQALVAAAGENQ